MKKWQWVTLSTILTLVFGCWLAQGQISQPGVVPWYSATPPTVCAAATPIFVIAPGFTGAGNLYGNTSTTTGTSCSQLGGGGGGGGTVTTFSAGALSPLFTTSVATATSTPALSFTLSNAAQNSVLAGPATGGAGAPSYQTAPTISAANMTNFPTLNQNTTGTAAFASGLNSTALAVANTWTANQTISAASNANLSLTQTGGGTSYQLFANGGYAGFYAIGGNIPFAILQGEAILAGSGTAIGFSSTAQANSGFGDTALARVSAGVMELGTSGSSPNALGTLQATNFVAMLGGLFETTHGSNATAGVSTLSSGTVTVSTTAIAALAAAGAAGDVVQLTLQSCSTCGTLSVGTVTPGTSFVINSTNVLDASNVYWEIKKLN